MGVNWNRNRLHHFLLLAPLEDRGHLHAAGNRVNTTCFVHGGRKKSRLGTLSLCFQCTVAVFVVSSTRSHIAHYLAG